MSFNPTSFAPTAKARGEAIAKIAGDKPLTVKPSMLAAILKETIPAKLPLLIAGPPGVGKTEIVKQAAAAHGAHCEIMHPVVNQPTDYMGVPWIVNGKAMFIPLPQLELMIHANKLTVVFLDDLGQAPQMVQAAAMQLLLERRINQHKVSDHVVFMAATNRRTDNAGVKGILEPVKSRFNSILTLEACPVDWRKWAVANKLRGEVTGFIYHKPAMLSQFEASGDMVNSPSPRTWEKLSQNLELKLPPDAYPPLIEGTIGKAAATDFYGFMEVWGKLVSPEAILTAPDTAPIPTDTPALVCTASALASYVRKPRMDGFARYLERLMDDNKGEYAAMSMKEAITRDPALTSCHAYIALNSGPLGKLMLGY